MNSSIEGPVSGPRAVFGFDVRKTGGANRVASETHEKGLKLYVR
jgi:hypothetical protein